MMHRHLPRKPIALIILTGPSAAYGLQMMHSQLTDFLSTHLAIEESLSTMFAVSLDTKVGRMLLQANTS